MSDINFAESKPSRRKRKKWPFVLVGIGVILMGVAAAMILPTFMHPARLSEFADTVKHRDDDQNKGDKEEEVVDWEEAWRINENVVAWIVIDGTVIDYPVAQSDDNEYFLHHDIYGDWSYSGVFADYRCDVDGSAVLVYGHHMDNGTMFENMSHTHHQDAFNSLGTLHWATPAIENTNYEPCFAMRVYADYAPVQEFEFQPTDEQLEQAARKVALDNHISTTLSSVQISTLPTKLQLEARNEADKIALRAWLKDMAKDAQASSSNMDWLIENADRVLTTTTCTSALDNDRTLTVFVHVD